MPSVPSLLATALLLTGFAAEAKPMPPMPVQTLPMRTHVYADAGCSRSRASLYYIPDGHCIGPLYHPAGSIRVANVVPHGCTLTAYSDGDCRGPEVAIGGGSGLARRDQKVLAGPTDYGSCFDIGEERLVEDGSVGVQGANSLFLRCGGS